MYAPKFRAAFAATLATAGVLTGISLVTPAHAAEAPIVSTAQVETKSIRVSYADLDLLEQNGVDKLNRRVRWAARSVCDAYNLQRPVKEIQASTQCFLSSLDRAGRDVELAVAEARSGSQLAARGPAGSIGVTSR